MKAELAHDVAQASKLPPPDLPEVALLGRSNVGKSSLINALLGRRRLARTSGTPGKTRRIQFYRIDAAAHLVDLPGYGYARVARTERAAWRALVEAYLRAERSSLEGALLLVDVRRDWRPEEAQLAEWLAAQQIPLRLVLTKADKLSRQAARDRERILAAAAGLAPDCVAAVSVHTGHGLGTLASWLEEWLGVALRRADGAQF